MILKRRKILKFLSYSLLFFCYPIKTIYAATKKIINQNLTNQQKDIMFNQGTERAFTSSLLNEKRNSILWFDDNFVGTELDPELSYAKVANACGLKGVTCKTMEETTKAIKQSCEDQKKGITTFIEIILNQELGEPFRRDAMKKPVEVAGIKKNDMKPQKSLI